MAVGADADGRQGFGKASESIQLRRQAARKSCEARQREAGWLAEP
jgi:hypothetical protein